MSETTENTQETVALPAHSLAVLSEIEQAGRDLQQQAQGVLLSAARELGLSGRWQRVGANFVREG